MKLVILYDRPHAGADPDQTDVLVQADAVGNALGELGHEYYELPMSLDLTALMQNLEQRVPDLVFNLVESVAGSSRLIHLAPSVLDFLGIPYTGAPTDALFLTSNKLLTKTLLNGAGIPTPEGLSLKDAQRGITASAGSYIIKSVWEHASIGIEDASIVTVKDPRQLPRELEYRSAELGRACFAERYIEGREFNVSLLAGDQGPQVLPPAEILFDKYPKGKARIVGYSAKWDTDSFEYHHTKRSFAFKKREKSLLKGMAEIARRCWRLFGLRGYARVDFRVDKENRPWVLEINANPCISPDAGFAAAAFHAGLFFREIVNRIINDTAYLNRSNGSQQEKPNAVDGYWHKGQGR